MKHLSLLLLPLLLVISACDRNDHDDHDHFISVDRVEVRDRDTNELYAVWQSGDQAFDDDAMPMIAVDDQLTLNVHFLDHENHEPHMGDEYFLDVRTAPGASTDVIDLEVFDDHVVVSGASVGGTEVVFELVHGNHADFTSVPLAIQVGANVQ